MVRGRDRAKSTLARMSGWPKVFDDDGTATTAKADPVGFVARLPGQAVLDELQRERPKLHVGDTGVACALRGLAVFSPLAGVDGDVDALLLPAGEPGQAVAHQIKRVKVSANTFHTLRPGKLGDLRKLIHQGNATVALGFARVVRSVLLATDGRSRVEFNFRGRGPTGEIIGVVGRALDLTDLDRGIGVARIEIAQPVNQDITLARGVGGWFVRPPAVRDQPAALPTAVAAYASSHAGA